MKDVIEYRGLFICKNDYGYVVKDDVDSSYNLHHGTFDSVNKAKSHIRRRQDEEEVKYLHERDADKAKLRDFEAHESELKKYITQLQDELKKERDENAVLKAGLLSVRQLMNDSYGVAGLHENGEVAPWNELEQGGRFEEWLYAFNRAENY